MSNNLYTLVKTDENYIKTQIQILSDIAHDLKSPLATIIGSLEICTLMDEKVTKEKRIELLNSALKQAYCLNSLITDAVEKKKLEV